MPRFDGTGPQGKGPFTGQGEGYCVVPLPKPGTHAPTVGYVGLQGTPLQPSSVSVRRRLVRQPVQMVRLGAWVRRNWRRAWRTGRGRRVRLGASRMRRW